MVATTFKNATSELLGTYVLVMTIACTALTHQHVWGPLAVASALMVMLYALGSVSGGHFNPAVTFSVWLNGTPGWRNGDGLFKVSVFVASQTAGAALAALTYWFVFRKSFALGPGAGFTWAGVCGAEALYTGFLCFVVLRAAVSASNPAGSEYFGLAIGFVIVAGGYAVRHISGAIFNPAAAIGIALASPHSGWWWFLYLIFELAGAAVGVICHRALETPRGGGVTPREVLAEPGRIFLAEFLGTFILVVTVGCNVLLGSSAPALSIAAALMCSVYALGAVSGAHLNPAVTVALWAAGKFPPRELPPAGKRNRIGLYFAAQFSGGAVGALTYAWLCGKGFPLQPGPRYLWGQAAVAELVYTFVLCFAVLNVTQLSRSTVQHVHGLVIGFCVVVGGYAVGAVSGAALNPAVSVGVDLAHAVHGGTFVNCIAYTLVQLLAGVMAAGFFYLLRDEEYSSDLLDGK